MHQTWIQQALTFGGGTLAVTRPPASQCPLDRRYMAEMTWPHATPPVHAFGKTPQDAIEALDERLQEDCADEMVKAGRA